MSTKKNDYPGSVNPGTGRNLARCPSTATTPPRRERRKLRHPKARPG